MPEDDFDATVQLRAHGDEVPARVFVDGDTVTARLDTRVRGIAPGQALVVYVGTQVIGSATIERTALETSGSMR